MKIKEVIKIILDAKVKFSMCLTGGGSRAVSKLLENGGASQVLDDVYIPYSSESLNNLLGTDELKSVSSNTLSVMALNYNKSGIFCTASLAKENQRPDRINEAFVANTINNQFIHITFNNKISRFQQENELANVILLELALAVNPDFSPTVDEVQELFPNVIFGF